MKLIELSCDHPSFHTLRFNPDGLTLIVGDAPEDKSKEGSSNGVGKTLALGLIHHCLGAKADATLKKAVPDWRFSLKFELDGTEHQIERTGDGNKNSLDGKKVSTTGLRDWLNECGAFYIDPQVPSVSFRSLFKRFARYLREDCLDPLRTNKEQDFEALLRTLYLLGVECSLAISKRQHKLDLDATARSLENWQADGVLKEVFRAGAQPKVRAEWLDREVPRLKADLNRFQVAENYRAIELQAGDLTRQLREIDKQSAVVRYRLEGIDKCLIRQPDISKADLLELYDGLQSIFRPETLAHFDAVEQFHTSLAANRRARFERDRAQLQTEAVELEAQRQMVAANRDEAIQSLQGKRALDEYASVARRLAAFEEERKRLHEFLNFSNNLQQRAQTTRERRVEEDRIAASYVGSNPLKSADDFFRELAELLYPRLPSGIVLENNTGNNQIRYDLSVQIEGDNSDGINAARILCFDWLLLMRGANHTLDFLWHDNRLFADIDPRARAAWFTHTVQALGSTGKQYIASINTENFEAMREFFADDTKDCIDASIKLTLRGDRPENKLLGIQFGK